MHKKINRYVDDLEHAMLYIGDSYLGLKELQVEINPDFDYLKSQREPDEITLGLSSQLDTASPDEKDEIQELIEDLENSEPFLSLQIRVKSKESPNWTTIKIDDPVSHYTESTYEGVATLAMDALLEHVNPTFMENFHRASREFAETVSPLSSTNHLATEKKEIADKYFFVRTTIVYLAGIGYAAYVEEQGTELLRVIRERQEEQKVARNLDPHDINPILALDTLDRSEASRMAAEAIYETKSPFDILPTLSKLNLDQALTYISQFYD